jgi:hypothetical protein
VTLPTRSLSPTGRGRRFIPSLPTHRPSRHRMDHVTRPTRSLSPTGRGRWFIPSLPTHRPSRYRMDHVTLSTRSLSPTGRGRRFIPSLPSLMHIRCGLPATNVHQAKPSALAQRFSTQDGPPTPSRNPVSCRSRKAKEDFYELISHSATKWRMPVADTSWSEQCAITAPWHVPLYIF